MDIPSGSVGSTNPVEVDAKLGSGKGQKEEKEEEKTLKVWVLRCNRTGRVLYLEVYKDFVDILFGFLTWRTGAVIKLAHEVSPMMKQVKTDTGIFNVYDSLQRLDDSLLAVDKELLLDPVQSLRVSEEIQSLDNHDFECCNADCSKYMAGSRQICRNCTISTHFSCITCGGYFRENAHTSLCYTPWRPWGNHTSAAPILTRYTVVQSCNNPTAKKASANSKRDAASSGYVKTNIPFIITDELHIAPLSTFQISQLLKKFGTGSCDDLECNELSVGTSEVIVMLGAAMTSPTPLTDVFGSMCNNQTKVSSSASFSQMPPLEKVSNLSDPDEDPLLSKLLSAANQLMSGNNEPQEPPPEKGSGEPSQQPLSRQQSLRKQSVSAEPPVRLPSIRQQSQSPAQLSSIEQQSEQPFSQESGNQLSSNDNQKPETPMKQRPSLVPQPPGPSERQGSILTRSPSSWLTYIRQSTNQGVAEPTPVPPNSKSIDNPLFQQISEILPDSSLASLPPQPSPPPPSPPPVDNSFAQQHQRTMDNFPQDPVYAQQNLDATANESFPPPFPGKFQLAFPDGSQGTVHVEFQEDLTFVDGRQGIAGFQQGFPERGQGTSNPSK